MKPLLSNPRSLVTLACLICGVPMFVAANPAGNWRGHIQLPQERELEIRVSLENSESADWEGSISIPQQGLYDFPLSKLSVEGTKVAFEMEGIPGLPQFAGVYEASTGRIEGDFKQGGQSLAFALARSEATEKRETSAEPVESAGKGIPGEGVVGEWFGELKVGPSQLRLALHLEWGPRGNIGGTLDSLDQNVHDLPIDRSLFEDGEFRFAITRIKGRFRGRLNEDGSELVGEWNQGGQTLPLRFRRVAERVSLNRPQEPQAPFPYRSEEVEFRNEAAGIQLAGTIVIPKGKPPFPAVVFVSGSGAQDRDEALAGHRPFLVMADSLARCGIASLRFDDRGFMKSEGDHLGSTTQDFATDALAALHYLESREEIDASWVGILGHSEGGLVGPIAAEMEEALDFLLLLAPPAEALDRLLMRQHSAIWRNKGIDEELIERISQYSEEEMDWIKDESIATEELKEKLRAQKAVYEEQFTQEERDVLGMDEVNFEASMNVVSTVWFRNLMRVDPAVYLEKVRVPTLALFAEKDIQVDAEVNSRLMREVFEKSGYENFELETFTGLNHLFQSCQSGSIDEYGTIEETISPVVLERMCYWITNTRELARR